jgi:hypothetical protein
MFKRLWLAARALVVPGWLPYALGASVLLGVTWYIYSVGAEHQRNADLVEIAKGKAAAQKHFAEQARANAAAVFALNAKHAAELIDRARRDDELTSNWQTEVIKSAELAKTVCWPKSTVKELRK